MVSTHRPLTEVYLVNYLTKHSSCCHLQPEPKASVRVSSPIAKFHLDYGQIYKVAKGQLGVLGKECIIPELGRVKLKHKQRTETETQTEETKLSCRNLD